MVKILRKISKAAKQSSLFSKAKKDIKGKKGEEEHPTGEALVEAFKSTHTKILMKHHETSLAFQETPNEWHRISDLLYSFNESIIKHSEMEDVHLYGYLRDVYSESETYKKYVNDIQRSMNKTNREISRFVRKYASDWESYKICMHDFPSDYTKTRGLLEQKIAEKEDTLYPLLTA